MKYLILILNFLLLVTSYNACHLPVNPNYLPEDIKNDPVPPKTNRPNQVNINVEEPIETDVQLDPYVKEYLDYAYDAGLHIDMQNVAVAFGDTSGRGSRVLAFCAFLRNGQNVVFVNKEKFYNSSESRKVLIIFHELGHCAQLRPHSSQYLTEPFIPRSLMYQFALKQDVFEENYNWYTHELFTYTGPKIQLPTNRGNELNDTVECDLESN